ncbi:hypothetical protein GCM10019995_09680 [Lactobacillus kefiranofaciens subsp. kefirgranum]|nr:hypothetical protein FC94_GL001608 [Lactobacillus kefiranofaciens subsp. kefirgranum DSM 10550 = JCM 8572]PAK98951.1 hypothetical protein B8W86_02245 [Lactobacillus kefiranofaciens]
MLIVKGKNGKIQLITFNNNEITFNNNEISALPANAKIDVQVPYDVISPIPTPQPSPNPSKPQPTVPTQPVNRLNQLSPLSLLSLPNPLNTRLLLVILNK